MSYELPGDVNPFEAPRAGIGEEVVYRDMADNGAELIREEHIGHEANIKSLGHLNYLGAFFAGLATLMTAMMAAGVFPAPANQRNGLDPTMQKFVFGGVAVFYLAFTVLNGALGYGLAHLQAWARWTSVVLTALALAGVAFYTLVLSAMVSPVAGLVVLLVGGGFNGLVLWLLVSKKAGVVFSPEYKEVIRKTPFVRAKTSLIVKIIIGAILAIVLFGFLSAFFSSR